MQNIRMQDTQHSLADSPWAASPGSVAAAWHVDPERGLSTDEVARRRTQHGPNALRATPPVPAWRRLLRQFNDPLIYLLLAAVVVSLLAWALGPRDHWPVDAMVIAGIVLLNALLGHLHEARAASAVAALATMTRSTASVLRDGQARRLPAEELVPGDILLLAEGDEVGADARLIQSAELRAQEASLTGESVAVRKRVDAVAADAALGDRLSMVFKGTAIAQGNARAVVTATGMQTQIGTIADLLDSAPTPPTPLQKEVARIGRMLGIAVLVIASVVVGTVLLLSDIRTIGDVADVLLLGVSLAVAAVPEGLPAILSLVLALGVQRMARRNAIVKQLSSVETLGSASVICTDKTGTLTRAEMTIREIASASGTTHVGGSGYVPHGEFDYSPEHGSRADLLAEDIVVLSGGSLASNAGLHRDASGSWEIHGDPTEAAFLVAERKLGVAERRQRRFTRVRELPFTSERKRMSSVDIDHEHHDTPTLICKGAPDVLLQHCTHLRRGMAVEPLDQAGRDRVLSAVHAFSDDALRTLGVAYRPLQAEEVQADAAQLERGLIYAGTVGIIDPPREEVADAIAQARGAGIRIVMITGDHPATALRIARDLGIADASATALTGSELQHMDDARFAEAVREAAVFARVAPEHKLRIVAALQAQDQVVAMTGDGVNDAPALKAADIGVAMGIAGTEVSKQAAHMILADDDFATIVEAVREGRGIFANIRTFLRYLLSSNMGEVLTVFLGVVCAGVIGLGTGTGGAVVLPLLATQILWINLITDSGPALAMGMDPVDGDAMQRGPRRLHQPVLDRGMWISVFAHGLVMALATLAALDWALPGGLMDGDGDIAQARTMAFTTLVLAQLFNAFNMRSDTRSAVHGLFANRWLWAAVVLSLLLQGLVVHAPILNTAFSTTPLDLRQWLICTALGSAVLWFGELHKGLAAIRRR